MNPKRNQPCPCGSGLKYKKCCGKILQESKPVLSPNSTNCQNDFIAEIDGDVLVVVPDSLDLITPYVVREQKDWFEDEIKFVRELMQPGMKVIDIGANYGLYALSMAKKVGTTGHVWAFEPTSATVSFLKRSVELNKFNNTSIIQCALSNRTGVAALSLDQNSELNMLCHEDDVTTTTENVTLTTLDQCLDERSLEQIEFVKLDAEGEESNIIRGGKLFFSRESPLVMYELKHGDQVNTTLIRQFEDIGYRPYRLIPGLNLLAPFDPTEVPDPYQLNLFGCKDDHAQHLEQRGSLVYSKSAMLFSDEPDDTIWQNYLGSKAYLKSMLSKWSKQFAKQPPSSQKDLRKSMELYALAHDSKKGPATRYAALKASFRLLEAVCEDFPNLGRLCTFARVSWEFGCRAKSLEIITRAIDLCIRKQPAMLNEPFLPVSEYYEDIDPVNRFSSWMLASLFEQMESLRSFSSYYTGIRSLSNLEELARTGFESPQMARRRQLIQKRYGDQSI